jgi:hypothetical protein
MADTTGEQLRVAIVQVGVAKYKVVTTVLTAGDLPDRGAFLVEILETTDPKRDKLARVCAVGDLTEWSLNRNTALINGDPFYRAFTWTEFYDKIEDAINAKDFFQEAVNTLVTDYQNFLTNFLADPAEALTWPTPDMGVLQPLIEDYYEKVQEVAVQQEVVDDKVVECNQIESERQAAQTSAELASASILAIDDSLAGLTQAESAMQIFEASSTGLQPGLQLTFDAWDAEENQGVLAQPLLEAQLDVGNGMRGYVENVAGWNEDVITFSNALATLTAKKDEITTTRGQLESDRVTAQNLADTLATNKATCDAELLAEQAALAELEQQRDDLLDDIIALCPDFTP